MLAISYVIFPTVPGATCDTAVKTAFTKRTSLVGADSIHGMESVVCPKDSDNCSVDYTLADSGLRELGYSKCMNPVVSHQGFSVCGDLSIAGVATSSVPARLLSHLLVVDYTTM